MIYKFDVFFLLITILGIKPTIIGYFMLQFILFVYNRQMWDILWESHPYMLHTHVYVYI